MADLVLDTNILADIIAQYYQNKTLVDHGFVRNGWLSDDITHNINKILKPHVTTYLFDEEPHTQGYIVASSMGFVEIARKFNVISQHRFTVAQMAALISQPPDWLLIESVSKDLLEFLCILPTEVQLKHGGMAPLEWADAIHVATALSRGDNCMIATTDRTIQEIKIMSGRVLS